MNAISDIVKLMDDDDIKLFKAYLQQKNKRGDVKNIKLLKAIKNDDINKQDKLYKGQEAAPAYHALRKRLYDSLVTFMANRTFETARGEANQIQRLLVVSRFFLEHQLTKTAFKCLGKAEAKALATDDFNLLNDIYHLQIQYAHLQQGVALPVLIEKFNRNREKLQFEEQLNIGYALLRRELDDVHHKGKIIDFTAVINDTMKSLGVSVKEILTFKSLYKILFIANEYATIQNNFTLIERFVEKSYGFISSRGVQAENHLYYHIYILYFMANINLRNHKFEESNHYLNLMHGQMLKQNRQYYNRFCLRYFLIKALNANFKGDAHTAITVAEEALAAAGPKADATDLNDLQLCLAMLYTQQGDKKAIRCMNAFGHTDSWYEKRMGMVWAIHRALLYIIILAEFDNAELALVQLKGFKRRYKKYLAEVGEERVTDYALLVEKLLLKPETAHTAAFKEKVAALHARGKEDLFVLSFTAWLLAKTNQKPVYETTLALLDYSSPSHSA